MSKILIVEDDETLAEQISSWLIDQKHTVETVHDGDEAYSRLKVDYYDLVILDWDLPKMNGIELLRKHRAAGGNTQVLMLTGKDSIDATETGLDTGADDYLTKPFHFAELSARIRAILRRTPTSTGTILRSRGIELDTATRRVFVCNAEIELQAKELAILEVFLKQSDTLFSPTALLEKIWSSESEATVWSVYTFIKTLRRKLTAAGAPDVIENVRGIGYRFNSKSD